MRQDNVHPSGKASFNPTFNLMVSDIKPAEIYVTVAQRAYEAGNEKHGYAAWQQAEKRQLQIGQWVTQWASELSHSDRELISPASLSLTITALRSSHGPEIGPSDGPRKR
jgi:hypothetical protein